MTDGILLRLTSRAIILIRSTQELVPERVVQSVEKALAILEWYLELEKQFLAWTLISAFATGDGDLFRPGKLVLISSEHSCLM